MKPKKDLSDLILDNAHKLEQTPSSNAWERLENRLDQKQNKPRFSSRNILSIAAATIGLLAVVSLISYMFQKSESSLVETTFNAVPEFIVQELEVPDELSQGFYKVVEFQQKYQDRLSNPVPEGSRKKLSVAKSYRGVLPNSALTNHPINFRPHQSNTKITATSGIQQFQWLTGKWESDITPEMEKYNTLLSVEHWLQTDARTLEGTGYLIVNEQTTFAEGMKIQQIGNELFFMADLDGSGNPAKYKLLSNSTRESVFENNQIPFPNQVIFKKTGKDKFTLILQNNNALQAGSSQSEYLKNRNIPLEDNQLGREMSRKN